LNGCYKQITMKKLNRLLFLIFVKILVGNQGFSQASKLTNSILTLGIYNQKECGLVNSFQRGTSYLKVPEDSISIQIKNFINAENIGTGFIYQRNGEKYVITCEHVVLKADQIIGYDAAFNKYELKLVGGDTFYDIAVLKFVSRTKTSKLKTIVFKTQLSKKDEIVESIGYWGLNGQLTPFSGAILEPELAVTSTDLPIAKPGLVKSTAKLPKGYSGGVLINKNGYVLGMNIMRSQRHPHYFSLKSTIVKRIVDDIIEEGKSIRTFTGIQFAQSNDSKGVTINNIIDASPAAKFRMKLENQIVSHINNFEVKDIYDVLQIMESIKPGSPTTIQLKNSKQTYTIIPEPLEGERLRQIAGHTVQYNKDIRIEGKAIIVKTTQEEIAKIAGVKYGAVYCIESVEHLGELIRLFGLQGQLKIGTDNDLSKGGRKIYFSENSDFIKVLYY